MIGILPLLVVTGLLVLCFAWLRETPRFWTNEGGHPPWLRETVLETFHPLLLLHFVLLVLQSVLLLRLPAGSMRCVLVEAGMLATLWCVLGFSLVVVAVNNLDNLIHGRPMHAHDAPVEGGE